MSDQKDKNNNKVVNIEKFQPKQIDYFTKEEMPFTLVCNKVINECLNPVAGFIWIYLQSKPTTWKPCKWEIMKRFNISESTYKRHIKYLTSTNLIETHMIRDVKGKIIDWRIVVLNGSRFNPAADTYKGTIYQVHINQSVKNDTLDEAALDKGSNQKVKNDLLDSPSRVSKHPGVDDLNLHINKDITSLEKKEKETPISPSGKRSVFSLSQMIQDNPFQIPESVLADWIEVRKAKRAKLTATAWKQANDNLVKLQQAGLDPIECFVKAVANGWAGIEFRYFERDIPMKPKYPTADERAANEVKIRERELKAAEERRKEIQENKGGINKLIKGVDIKAIRAKQEAEQLALGMSVTEYHEYVINKRAMQE